MQDNSLQKQCQLKLGTAEESVRRIRSDQRVFIGSACGEPQHLVNALMDNANYFSDVEIVRLLSLEGSLIALIAHTHSNNKGMIKLFNKLPCKVETILEDGMLVLKCNFEEPL